jgi:tetratricopeptide (TPR) repeat protein
MNARSLHGFLLVGSLAASAACTKDAAEPSAAPAPVGPTAEGRTLLEQGRLDDALARLQDAAGDPEALYLQGRVWAKKAETAPLPTPPPAASPLPRGAAPPAAPEFKDEELRALAAYEKAIAARPELGEAHLGVAELLAPHAIRHLDRQRAAPAPRARRRGAKAAPVASVAAASISSGGVDFGADRIVNAYTAAARSSQVARAAADGLISVGTRAGRVDAAEAGFRQLLELVKEKPEPFIQYGNFLLEHKGDSEGAIEQYRQALIWKSDDEATRLRIADIYLARGAEHFGKQHFALADQAFKQAAKWVAPGSPQEQQLRSYQRQLLEIRVPAVR